MKLKQHNAVELKLPEFEVDKPLAKHLDEIPLLSHLNKSFACGFIGRAGSGKTSLMTGLLQTKNKFKKVFHKIYLFMPSYSRQSMKKCIFDCLPQEQIFGELNLENLLLVEDQVKQNTENNLTSLIIFDDVQDAFKGECENLILKLINNRRHMRLSIMVIAQSYMKISFSVRKALTSLFLFNLSKEDYAKIYEERLYFPKTDWETILTYYRKENNNIKGNFIFLDPEMSKVFINWNEIIIDE